MQTDYKVDLSFGACPTDNLEFNIRLNIIAGKISLCPNL